MVVKNSTNQTITQYNVQTGDALNSLNQVPPLTSKYILTSNGPSSQPSFQPLSAGFVSGTWTPILYGASTAGVTTYNVQDGTYVQFGNLVWVRMYLQVATATGTGDAIVDGLPFTIFNNSASFTNSNLGVGSWTWPIGSVAPIFFGMTNTTTGKMAMNGSAIATQYMQVQNGIGSFAFNMIYQVSA